MKDEELKHEQTETSHTLDGPYPHHTFDTGPDHVTLLLKVQLKPPPLRCRTVPLLLQEEFTRNARSLPNLCRNKPLPTSTTFWRYTNTVLARGAPPLSTCTPKKSMSRSCTKKQVSSLCLHNVPNFGLDWKWGHHSPHHRHKFWSFTLGLPYSWCSLPIMLNIDGSSIPSRSHTHPSHTQNSRLLSSSLSLGVPSPRSTQCMWDT